MTVDWSNTVLYKLCSNNPLIEDEYVGKSGDFHIRKIAHKSVCNNVKSEGYNYEVYKFIRENGGYDNWDFEILETANLENEKEASNLERYWIEKLKPSLNKNLPAQTPEELAEYNREYNREYCRIRHRQKMEDPEYRKENTETTKKWAVDNPEKAAALVAASQARGKEKITCVCGAIHSRQGKSQHLKRETHKEYLKNNPVEA